MARVFISYAHTSEAHKGCVAGLVAVLRAKGLSVSVDSDVKSPQGPPKGWPRWMKEQIKKADWVLIFFDELYRLRFDGEDDPDRGLGATWEGVIITHELYIASVRNEKFIPLLADGANIGLIPDELRGATWYYLPSQSDQLAESLAQAPITDPGVSVAGPSPGTANTLPQIAPTRLRHGAEHLFGREKELAALDEAWNNPAKHVLTIVAWGGVGKTSLVVEWMAHKAAANWSGFDRVFDWSFYSQGARERGAASADTFVAEALKFFGDKKMAHSPASPWDKGAHLAQLVAQHRTLLVLDGLEPLQYPPGPMAGQLKDPALAVLLKGLGQINPGLCIVTTRESLADLAPYRRTTAPEWPLEHLAGIAGAALLHQMGARRAGAAQIKRDDPELLAASREVDGHALTLHLLGRYLAKAHGGDIRQRDRVKFEKADATVQGGHAFRALAAYEKWFTAGGKNGAQALAILRLLGLFDRPADSGCLAALRREPPIRGLTDALFLKHIYLLDFFRPRLPIEDADWNLALAALADCDLVSVHPDKKTIDAHPIIREYFASQLHGCCPKAWRAAHQRLYEYLKETTYTEPKPSLEDLQPLYQAVAHGCQAGLYSQACRDVYFLRIQQGQQMYSMTQLGAIGADLGAIACFFVQPWVSLAPDLEEEQHGWLLNEAATRLRALGRLTEALEPFRSSVRLCISRQDWEQAGWRKADLSALELTMGEIHKAVLDGNEGVGFANRCDNIALEIACHAELADAFHQSGSRVDAMAHFRKAEIVNRRSDDFDYSHPYLVSMFGFLYCDLLLAEPERAAWRQMGFLLGGASDDAAFCLTKRLAGTDDSLHRCDEVEYRANYASAVAYAKSGNLLDIALFHLMLGRTALYRGILDHSALGEPQIQSPVSSEAMAPLDDARSKTAAAMDGFRRAGTAHHQPRGLMCRAWLRFLTRDTEGARADLDEAWQIAERGPMQLFMADIHLHRARLFRDKGELKKAGKLIRQLGYGRRNEELADAEEAARGW